MLSDLVSLVDSLVEFLEGVVGNYYPDWMVVTCGSVELRNTYLNERSGVYLWIWVAS